jgi:imidazolonepropionase-like amidohydrolase
MRNIIKSLGSVLALIIVVLVATTAVAQIPEKATFGKYALINAEIHTVSNGVIKQGTVLINGKNIEFVGTNAKITDEYQVIDCSGKRIYPGFIDSHTYLGLVEISAVPVTVDNAEVGNYNPQMRAFTSINPTAAAIPVTRVSGVTTVIAAPTSGRISGKSTLINLYGYSPDSMAVAGNAALHMTWPALGGGGGFGGGGGGFGGGQQRTPEQIREAFEQNLREIQEYFDRAKFYDQMMDAYESSPAGKRRPDKDQQMDAMREVIDGKIPVVITVNTERDILEALKWIDKNKQLKFVLASVAEGWRVADKIAESGVPVVVGPMLRTPTRGYDNYQRPYQNAALLAKAGVKIAIMSGDTENVRNLIYNAGYAATYGLGTEDAVKAITLNPAEIFGVADKVGSITEGKMANLFIADGDPFEPSTRVEQVFIGGNKIPMVSRQNQLYIEFIRRDPSFRGR